MDHFPDEQRCRHIKINGERCGAPRMNRLNFCYFHRNLYRRHRGFQPSQTLAPVRGPNGELLAMEPTAQTGIALGLLEDRASVQAAISVVVNALATNQLELRRAGILLYGLQLASSNCAAKGSANAGIDRHSVHSDGWQVDDTTDEDGNLIADE